MAQARDAPIDVLVLVYHAVSEHWDADTTVTPEQLSEQIGYLLARGYTSVTFERALATPPPGKVLAITFDDAHRSVFEVAFPLLHEIGAVATVYAPTDYIGTGAPTGWDGFEAAARGPHAPELVCMDWEQLGVVADAGWEVGSHTRSHPHLTRLPDSTLRDELVGSREVLEQRLGRPCRTLAYPYGDHDARVVKATELAGYAFACTAPVGHQLSLPLRWGRVGSYRSDSQRRFRLLTSRAARGFLATATGTLTADTLRSGKAWARKARRG